MTKHADRDKSEQPVWPPHARAAYLDEPVPYVPAESADDERVAKYAEAINELAVDHPMWIGDDGGALDYHPDRELYLGDFVDEASARVMAVADAEQAELRAKIARVEGLAAEIQADANCPMAGHPRDLHITARAVRRAILGRLNAALDGAE